MERTDVGGRGTVARLHPEGEPPGHSARAAGAPSVEVDMAYLLHHFWTGGTEDQYRAMLKAVPPSTGLPEGQTHHVAGPTDGGFLITAVWDSRASADRFVQGL